jgi:hypothetical protein
MTDLFGVALPTDDALAFERAKRLRQMDVRRTNILPGQGKTHYSDDWFTPAEIPKALGEFDLDPCAGPMRHARRNIRLPDCGLAAEWKGRVWLNPPYSNVHEWLDKMVQHANGVALVNARPETLWFQRALKNAIAVFWLRGRIDFLRPDGVATHPPVGSVMIGYGEKNAAALEACELPGVAMRISSATRRYESARAGLAGSEGLLSETSGPTRSTTAPAQND